MEKLIITQYIFVAIISLTIQIYMMIKTEKKVEKDRTRNNQRYRR